MTRVLPDLLESNKAFICMASVALDGVELNAALIVENNVDWPHAG